MISCIFDLLSGRCPEPIFDLLLSYPNSSRDFGGLGGHLNLSISGDPDLILSRFLRRADTQTPTRHSVFSTSTPTRKRFPYSTVKTNV